MSEQDAVLENEILTEPGTLAGDLRDAILDRIRHQPKPWEKMGEAEQTDMIYGVESLAKSLVREAVRLIAAQGRTTIMATLEQCTVKDGIKAVLTMSQRDPHRHDLTDSVGKVVLVVVADAEDFMGESKPAKAEPDQQDLESVAAA